jgi:hypothetical protein
LVKLEIIAIETGADGRAETVKASDYFGLRPQKKPEGQGGNHFTK